MARGGVMGILLGSVLAVALAARGGAPCPLSDGDRIAFLGDSITQAASAPEGFITLVSNAVHRAMPSASIGFLNAGRSGNRINDLQARLDVHVLTNRPTIVVISIGINDAWLADHGMGTTPQAFASGLRDLVSRCRAARARPVLCTPTVIGERSDGGNRFDAALDGYAAMARRVAAETGSPLVDQRDAFLARLREINAAQAERGILTVDGVHPNAAGNRLFAVGLLRVFGTSEEAARP